MWRSMKTVVFDILALCGIASVVYGSYQASPPLAWIIGGLAFVIIAVAGAGRWDS